MSRTHYRKLLENEYLGQWDLIDADGNPREATLVIESVEVFKPEVKQRKKMADGTYKDARNNKLRIVFGPTAKGKPKPWLAGPVSQQVIRNLYGPYIEDWVGKRITIYCDPSVTFGKTTVGGVRVKPEKPTIRIPTSDAPRGQVDAAKSEQLDQARREAGIREPGED